MFRRRGRDYSLSLARREQPRFSNYLREVSQYLAASPHCRGYQVLRGIEDANRFIVIIEWDSIEGHEQGFTNSADFPQFITPLRPYLQYIEEMKHYEKTDIARTK
ncbi:MAG: antibiotic biosynthesis monooxygenase [Acidobacteria bacterium]|nr:antibiotic biosynthesis monooxygenase [Acidobacteriota bacterium]